MLQNGIDVARSTVGVMGITFKENCPDIRNSRVIDVVRELKDYGCEVVVHDPWADADDVRHEYGLDLLPELDSSAPFAGYDAVVLAVAHDKFRALDFSRLKKETAVLFDIKGLLPRDQVDGRL
jgi:UDP-N-acetyl-D-galactosamine dehydrogenase